MHPMSGHSTVHTAPRKAACATHKITVPRPSAQTTKPIFTKSQESHWKQDHLNNESKKESLSDQEIP